MGLAIEHQTRQVSEIIDNYEKLKEEFLLLNIQEVVEKNPHVISLLQLNLNNIQMYQQVAFVFLDGIRKLMHDE